MADDKVVSFPHWKRSNSSAIDKLRELLEYAERHPEDVKDLILLWENAEGFRQAETDSDLMVMKAVYMLEQAKFDMLVEM